MPKSPIEALRSVLGYASFPNREIREQVGKVIEAHRKDLDDVGMEPSTSTESEIRELERVLNEYDDKNTLDRDALKEAIKESREEEEATS